MPLLTITNLLNYKDMITTREIKSLDDFKACGEAVHTLNGMNDYEKEELLKLLEKRHPQGMKETELNDYLSNHTDEIAQELNYWNWNDLLLERQREVISWYLMYSCEDKRVSVDITLDTNEDVGLSDNEKLTITEIWQTDGIIAYRLRGYDGDEDLDDHREFIPQICDYFKENADLLERYNLD